MSVSTDHRSYRHFVSGMAAAIAAISLFAGTLFCEPLNTFASEAAVEETTETPSGENTSSDPAAEGQIPGSTATDPATDPAAGTQLTDPATDPAAGTQPTEPAADPAAEGQTDTPAEGSGEDLPPAGEVDPPAEYDAQITVLDYGICGMTGDAVLIESAGKYILMDTGYTNSPKDHSLSNVIVYLKEHNVHDLDLYLSHYHNDHYYLLTTIMRDPFFNVGTLYLPKEDNLLKYTASRYRSRRWYRYYTKNVMKNGRSWEKHSYTEIMETVEELGIHKVTLTRGSQFTVGDAQFEVLWHNTSRHPVSNDWSAATTFLNNESLVTMVKLGGVRYLTCGDLETAVEKQVVARKLNIRADIYKANHHGGDTSNTYAFLKAVRPQYAFSTGYDSARMNQRVKDLGFNFASMKTNGILTYTIRDGEITFDCTKNYVDEDRLIRLADGTKEVRTFRFAKKHKPYYKAAMIPKGAYYCSDRRGWITSNKKKYYYDEDGIAVRGPFTVGGRLYFFDRSNGRMLTGWIKDPVGEVTNVYYADKSGVCAKGWKTIDKKKYYFHDDGIRQPEGSFESEGAVWHFGADCVLAYAEFDSPEAVPSTYSGFGDVTVSREENGESVTEVCRRYYEKGRAVTGWKTIGGKKYWFASGTGDMARGITRVSGKDYYLAPDTGVLKTGWIETDGGRLYADKKGVLAAGITTIGNKQYGFDKSTHLLLTGVRQISGRTYAFDQKGILYWLLVDNVKQLPSKYTGLVLVRRTPTAEAETVELSVEEMEDDRSWADGEVYYFSKGKKQKGWKIVSGRKYYFLSNYRMARGVRTISKKAYFFHEITGMRHRSGWATAQDGAKYYARSKDSALLSGWQKLDGKKYYFSPKTHAMCTGLCSISGKKYYFDENGVMQTGEVLLDGRIYVFNKNGILTSTRDAEPEEPETEAPEVEGPGAEVPVTEPAEEPSPVTTTEETPAQPGDDGNNGQTDGTADLGSQDPDPVEPAAEESTETEPAAESTTEAPAGNGNSGDGAEG